MKDLLIFEDKKDIFLEKNIFQSELHAYIGNQNVHVHCDLSFLKKPLRCVLWSIILILHVISTTLYYKIQMTLFRNYFFGKKHA